MKINTLRITFIFSIALMACNSAETSSHETNEEDDTINYIQKEIDINNLDEETEVKEDSIEELKTYKGNWFDISYPSNFTSSPSSPIIARETYKFVDTDEAYFLSADGTVEFFVYSPQWGGNPINYLELADNEEIDSKKTTIDEIDPEIIMNWVTYKDKDGNYLRSYFSKQTASTHKVFGIKYTNQTSYDLHKDEYDAFKKSLIQYAD